MGSQQILLRSGKDFFFSHLAERSESEMHINVTCVTKGIEEGQGELGGGDGNLSLWQPFPLIHLPRMRRDLSKIQRRVVNFFYIYNTLCCLSAIVIHNELPVGGAVEL